MLAARAVAIGEGEAEEPQVVRSRRGRRIAEDRRAVADPMARAFDLDLARGGVESFDFVERIEPDIEGGKRATIIERV